MKYQKLIFSGLVNEEIGLGRRRSEISDIMDPGPFEKTSITIEEEVILTELGLGNDFSHKEIQKQADDENCEAEDR